MPGSPVTRQRVISRDTCILGFTGNMEVLSYVFDATTLVADSNGFYYIPDFSFVTPSVASDPTKIKVYQGLGTNVNAVQTITETGTPTGGTFTLTFNGQTTAAIAYNATAAVIASALELLGNIGTVNITTGGGALPTAVTVTFSGILGNQPVPVMTANYAALTGGSTPAIAVATTTTGQTAEHIIGVFDHHGADFFGNAVADDEAVAIYNQFTAFDTTKLVNWMSYGAIARTALPTCTFQP